jgi:type IV secretory pathway protease TraF
MMYKIVTLTALLVLYGSTIFIWNISDSAAPEGLYRVTYRPLTRGRLVLLRNPLKAVVGLPGDTITWAADGVYVNGKRLSGSQVPEGSPYDHYPYGTKLLAPGQYLFMGENPLSQDGRYEGPQTGTLIRAVITPVITK